MTPPPKPFTEKEINDMEKRFFKMRAEYDAWNRSMRELDQSWVIANFGNIISELKRTRSEVMELKTDNERQKKLLRRYRLHG